MVRKISVYVALIIASICTINAFWLGMNNQSTIDMFNRYPILFAPANYVYFIWLLIILLFIVYLMLFKDSQVSYIFKTNLQIALFVCYAAVHILVLYIWHQNQYMSAIILMCAMLLLLYSLYLTYPITKNAIKYRTPIALLFSWQLFLFLLMINFSLVRFEWSAFNLSMSLWTVIFMTLGTIFAMYLKFNYEDKIAPFIFIWGYIGIAVSNGFNELLVTAAALFLSSVLFVSVYILKKKREAN